MKTNDDVMGDPTVQFEHVQTILDQVLEEDACFDSAVGGDSELAMDVVRAFVADHPDFEEKIGLFLACEGKVQMLFRVALEEARKHKKLPQFYEFIGNSTADFWTGIGLVGYLPLHWNDLDPVAKAICVPSTTETDIQRLVQAVDVDQLFKAKLEHYIGVRDYKRAFSVLKTALKGYGITKSGDQPNGFQEGLDDYYGGPVRWFAVSDSAGRELTVMLFEAMYNEGVMAPIARSVVQVLQPFVCKKAKQSKSLRAGLTVAVRRFCLGRGSITQSYASPNADCVPWRFDYEGAMYMAMAHEFRER